MSTTTGTPPTTNGRAAEAYEQLISHVKEAQLLGSTAGLLGWDQETMMPPKGLPFRSQQLALLAKMAHGMRTDPRIGEWLDACESDTELTAEPTSVPAVNLREIRRDYDRSTKLPSELVVELSQTSSMAKAEWKRAREQREFGIFKPHLEKIVELNRRKAECYGWPSDGEPWDALADGFEPGCTAKEVETAFKPLREKLVALLTELMGSSTQPSDSFNRIKLPLEQQKKFVRYVVEQFGFDFERGRLDISTHPFCGGTHCNDVRMTTRFHEDNLSDALGSTMHEAGHGIYNQGLPEEHIGTPAGASVSLGIHESQSRMWENQVGRSKSFWQWLYPKLKDFFGEAVADLSFDEVYGSNNVVKPDFIRVEADEATYNMHIMVRFEIERAMMNGKLEVKDVPEYWNAKYKEYLDVDVPNDAKGCLQDIHWSMGSIGYFPTYTLGNLYAAQFFDKAKEEIPDLEEQFARGEFSALKTWLNEKIHSHGKRYRAADLCRVVTGKELSAEPLMNHLNSKLRPLYGLA